MPQQQENPREMQGSTSTANADVEYSTNKTPPKILTRSTDLPSLSALDAGDVVECYALTRMAKLENSMSASTSPLVARKSAIAFRYKPKSSSPDANDKEPFELTLEYGPQRTGSTQSFEAMPSVNGHVRGLGYEDSDGMYVSWENHAKIYYALSISDEDWDHAYYMAPLTGAVLSKILNDYIMDYPNLHPRYQPFSVVEKSSGKAVLNSSNSEDFVWNVLRRLASMYVAIDPILVPKRYTLQLSVDNVERDVLRLDSNVVVASYDVQDENGVAHERKQNVANVAADFYYKLYSCMDAIKTGDYSMYHKTLSPSASPSTYAPTVFPSLTPTEFLTENNTTPDLDDDNTTSGIIDSFEDENDGFAGLNNDDYYLSPPETDGPRYDNRHLRSASSSSLATQEEENTQQNSSETVKKKHHGHDKAAAASNDNDKNVMPFVGDAKLAAEEAEKAAEFAKEAAESTEDVKATEAAELAAAAAKKAAKATSEAANEAAMESILSGDGDLMMNVIQTCFSDPKYGIWDSAEENENSTVSVNAFLYVDGSHYYRLNLTAPYVSIETYVQPLPKVSYVPDGKSDAVDVGLAVAILGAFFFGVIVMLHHIRVLSWDERLQFKWFFHPSHVQTTKRGGYRDAPNDDDSLSLEGPNCDLELTNRQIPNGIH